jgi:hypothetical protein
MVVAVDLPGLFTSVGALLTAIGGFILVIRRLGNQETKVNRIDDQLNGVDRSTVEGGLTLAQRVDRIDRNTSEGFRVVTGELEALSATFRQHSLRMDEVIRRVDAKADELEERLRRDEEKGL